MKSKWVIHVVAAVVLLLFCFTQGPEPARASVEVSFGYFYNRLSMHGHWVQHRHHGWVWYPSAVPMGWRPYTHGHWVWTDEYGWLWDSDWEWGWAPFHYGRWFFDDEYGWVWVPGYEWGPAWVAWRSGEGYIGWTPLPPDVTWHAGYGFRYRRADWYAVIPGTHWVFVEDRVFVSPQIHRHVYLPARNVTIIKRTKNVTNYVFVNNRVVNRSVPVENIERGTKTRIHSVKVREVDSVSDSRLRRLDRQEEVVFRPAVRPPRPDERPPRTVDERQKIERSALEERHRVQRQRLNVQQRRERRTEGAPVEELQQRQRVEREVLQETQQWERGRLEKRQKSERQMQREQIRAQPRADRTPQDRQAPPGQWTPGDRPR